MFQAKLALHYGVSLQVAVAKISPLCCKTEANGCPVKGGEGRVPADGIGVL